MSTAEIEQRVAELVARGVTVVDPRQTYVAPEVDLVRIHPAAILHPGTRLVGARTFVGPAAEIGREGPAVLVDSVVAAGARFDGGYAEHAVLLRGARAGSGAHLRAGTILEEESSTAHCVGLKHTIVFPFVTIGSLVNLCDALIAGGSSREDHSEVGSGYIHFNYTPWGRRGDKATASMIGDVEQGVFLRQSRIFLGGSGGMVGPRRVGYGSVVAAGQVVREDVGPDRMVARPPRVMDVELVPGYLDAIERRWSANVASIGQLVALEQWYRRVRLPRIPSDGDRTRCIPVEEAAWNLREAIHERIARLQAYATERATEVPQLEPDPSELPACPLRILPGEVDHIEWLRTLSDQEVEAGSAWLSAIAERVRTRGTLVTELPQE